MRDIRPLIAPRSVAVIGASSNPTKAGGMLFANLAQGDFAGALYPINPRAAEVMGKKAYPSLKDVPGPVDLVFIVLPRQHVEPAIAECIAAGARSACIITAGFAETGEAGRAEERKLADMARRNGLLLAGPNTIGMVNGESRMMGSFVKFPRWESGCVSLFAQTGVFAGGVILEVMSADAQRLPVGKSIDVGNKMDVDELDFLHFAEADPTTRVIGLYLESIRTPDAFFANAKALRGKKPIVVLHPGRTRPGSAASALHTGSLPYDDAALDARLKEAGILRADDEEDFLNTLKALAMLPRPRGKRVGIASTSGALGVMSTDLVVQHGLEMAQFAPASLPALASILPDWLQPSNPVDFWISVDLKGPREAHEVALRAVFADPNVDLVLLTLLAGPTSDYPEFPPMLRALRAQHDKPVALLLWGGLERNQWIAELEGADIPLYRNTRSAVKALASVVQAYA